MFQMFFVQFSINENDFIFMVNALSNENQNVCCIHIKIDFAKPGTETYINHLTFACKLVRILGDDIFGVIVHKKREVK